jgi:hypothetical protein
MRISPNLTWLKQGGESKVPLVGVVGAVRCRAERRLLAWLVKRSGHADMLAYGGVRYAEEVLNR